MPYAGVVSLLLIAIAAPSIADENVRSPGLREILTLRPDPAEGQVRYEASCVACHQAEGGGVPDGSVPAVAGQHAAVLVKQLVDFRDARRWDPRMEHFADRYHLEDGQDVANVAAYVASLRRSTGGAVGTGEFLDVGAQAYLRLCASCHRPIGQGHAARFVPRLASQHYGYLVRQLQDSVEGRRPNMAGAHASLVSALDWQQIQGIADYLSRCAPELQLMPRSDPSAE
jgi:cytochrome c553